jgi:hypothetical protein
VTHRRPVGPGQSLVALDVLGSLASARISCIELGLRCSTLERSALLRFLSVYLTRNVQQRLIWICCVALRFAGVECSCQVPNCATDAKCLAKTLPVSDVLYRRRLERSTLFSFLPVHLTRNVLQILYLDLLCCIAAGWSGAFHPVSYSCNRC